MVRETFAMTCRLLPTADAYAQKLAHYPFRMISLPMAGPAIIGID